MSRNSQGRQFNNYPGYLTSQHQQPPQYISNPPLEAPVRYQPNNYNNRNNLIQTQSQTANINTAPVPGAPAARFDGQVPFHGSNNPQWSLHPSAHMLPSTMVQGQPQLQQRPFMYPGQHANAYSAPPAYVQNVHYQMPVARPPNQAPSQATTFSSGMPQTYPPVPLPTHTIQSQMPQLSTSRQVPMNTIQNQIQITGSQGPQTQYGTSVPQMNHMLPPSQGHQSAHIQKRVPKPLAVIDPKTKKRVDLNKTGPHGGDAEGGAVVESAYPLMNDQESKNIEDGSVMESGSESQKIEIDSHKEGTLNPAADSFFPHADISNKPVTSDNPDTENEPLSSVDASAAQVVQSEEETTEIMTNVDEPPVSESEIAVGDIQEEPEVSDVQPVSEEPNAADETVSDEAAVDEQPLIESEQVITSTEPTEREKPTEHYNETPEIINGDETDKQESDIPSQDEDDRTSGASSPPSYNFRVDSTEAPATTAMRKLYYDRDYLIKLQRCNAALKQPKGLPEELIEQGVILKEANPLDLSKPLPALKTKDMNDFTPEYVRLGQGQYRNSRYPRDGQRTGAGGSGGGGGRNQYSSAGSQRRGSQQSTRRIEASHRQPVKIHQAENAYVPAIFQRNKNVNPDEESEEARNERETQVRMRTCFSLLNKLTPQNSDVIFHQIKESGILYNTNGIHDMALAIFKKAITEPPYSVALADLVANIMSEFDNDDVADYRSFFKTTLLTQCQQMFETDLEKQVSTEEDRMRKKMEEEKDAKIKVMLSEEIEEAKLKVRAKYYGNIKFVGELYLRGFLGAKTIHNCIAMLLQEKNEESIESVCKFLETTGEKLDQGMAVKRLDTYFQRITHIKDKIESQRLKFKLEDLIDMRNRKWKLRERAAEYQVRPRTRAELERERIEEENKKQAAVDKMYARKREEGRYGNRASSGYSGRQPGGQMGQIMNSRRSLQPEQSNQQKNAEGWQTVQPTARRAVDTRTLILNKTDSAESDVKLGPGASLSRWSQGCRSKGRDTGGDRVTATKNLGRQGLSPSPRNSANSSRRGSNSNIPASISSGTSSTAQTGVRDSQSGRAGGEQPQNGSSEVVNNATVERPPLDNKMRMTVENKTQHIFSEYSVHKEFDGHAFESIKSYGDIFVESLIQEVIEKSKMARIDAGNMVTMMIQNVHLRPEDVSEGLKPTLESAADILMDVPKLYSYIAEFLSGCISVEVLALLPSLMENLEEKDERANIVCEMLHLASEVHGHDKVGTMFRTAGLDWYMFFTPSQNYENFVKTNKLEFTVTGGVLKVPESSVSLDDLEAQLMDLIGKADMHVEDVFSLIESSVDKHTFNSSEVVSMCFRAIVELCIKNSDYELLQTCSPVLRFIINNNEDRMMTALYAIQQITPKIQDKNRINAVIQLLSESKVISDDIFLSYYHTKKPKISDGYKDTIKAARDFFAMLLMT